MKILKIIPIFFISFTTTFASKQKTFIICLGGWNSTSGDGWTNLAQQIQRDKGYDIISENEKFSDKDRKDNTVISYDIHIDTIDEDIEVQAKRLHSALKKMGIENGDNIVLVALSQGGLRAWAFLKEYNKDYNIRGLFSAGSPWGGAHILNSNKRANEWKEDMEDKVTDAMESIPLIGFLIDAVGLEEMLDPVTDKLVEELVYHDFAYNEGSKFMRPEIGANGEEQNVFLSDIYKPKETGEGKETYFGAYIGTDPDIFKTWLLDHEGMIEDAKDVVDVLVITSDILYSPFSLLPFMPDRSELSINLMGVSSCLEQEIINAWWSYLITSDFGDHNHDALIKVEDQYIEPHVLKSIKGVKGRYIGGDRGSSNVKVSAGHTTSSARYKTTREILYNDFEVIAGISGWVYKIMDEIGEEVKNG